MELFAECLEQQSVELQVSTVAESLDFKVIGRVGLGGAVGGLRQVICELFVDFDVRKLAVFKAFAVVELEDVNACFVGADLKELCSTLVHGFVFFLDDLSKVVEVIQNKLVLHTFAYVLWELFIVSDEGQKSPLVSSRV